jgi:hypothetical protein
MPSALEDVARDYVWALKRAREADSAAARTAALVDVDAALHDLVIAAGEPCIYCEAGTCPNTTDTPPL